MFDEDFASRLLPFCSATATAFAEIVAVRRASGRPISQINAQIAEIARRDAVSVATRNVDDFSECGIAVLHPWLPPLTQLRPARPPRRSR